jgi:hypothetical protein
MRVRTAARLGRQGSVAAGGGAMDLSAEDEEDTEAPAASGGTAGLDHLEADRQVVSMGYSRAY